MGRALGGRWPARQPHRSRPRPSPSATARSSTSPHDRGERFDRATGEPLSWAPSPGDITVVGVGAPVDRRAVGGVAASHPSVGDRSPEPLRPARRAGRRRRSARRYSAARHLGSPPMLDPHDDRADDECAKWLARWSRPLSELTRANLATGRITALARGLDGSRSQPGTAGRYRKVARGLHPTSRRPRDHPADPWPPPARGRGQRKTARRSRPPSTNAGCPNPATMRRAIDAIRTHQPSSRTYQVMTAVAYYAGLRPSEVVMLRTSALTLPAAGWGRIDVVEADIDFIVPGEPKTGPRSVPIPPVLVADAHGVDRHPRRALSATACSSPATATSPTPSNWSRAWHRALRSIDHPPLRIYDCRHAAATDVARGRRAARRSCAPTWPQRRDPREHLRRRAHRRRGDREQPHRGLPRRLRVTSPDNREFVGGRDDVPSGGHR